MLPNFFLIGAPKAGSTSLYHYLRHHPQVFMPAEKEPEYFLGGPEWEHGRERYEALFAGAGDALAVGEASVRYSVHPYRPGAPERIAALIPDPRLLYIVRDPVDRMVSQWMHNVRIYAERRPLQEALRSERYLTVSRYAYQLERFLEHFPRERLLVVISERMRDDREAELDRVFEFLGVEPRFRSPAFADELNTARAHWTPRAGTRRVRAIRGVPRVARRIPARISRPARRLTHAPSVTPVLSASVAHELRELLSEDVARLREYVEVPFDGWGIA